jgi:hypothetical protein
MMQQIFQPFSMLMHQNFLEYPLSSLYSDKISKVIFKHISHGMRIHGCLLMMCPLHHSVRWPCMWDLSVFLLINIRPVTDQCNTNLCQPFKHESAIMKSATELVYVCSHVSTWLPLDRFSQNLILKAFNMPRISNVVWVKTIQKEQAFRTFTVVTQNYCKTQIFKSNSIKPLGQQKAKSI